MNEKDLSYFVGSKIKDLRKKNNITQSELGRMLNVKNNTISAYERGVISTDQDVLFKLADIFKVSIDDFFPNATNNVMASPNAFEYPLYPPISAGLPIEIGGLTEDDVETISIPDYLMGKWAGNKQIYFTRTNGDSMNKTIPHNSLIAVRPVSLEQLKNNDIVVYSKNGEYAVKRYFNFGDEVEFRPDSTDESFRVDTIKLDNDIELKIKGKVVLYIVELD